MDWKQFELETFTDARGSLTPVELKDFIDFEVKRIYTVHHNHEKRGGHAHLIEKEFFMLSSGTCLARVHDGTQWHEVPMEANKNALYVGNHVWHEFDQFSEDGVLLALSSTNYSSERTDYVEEFERFMSDFGA